MTDDNGLKDGPKTACYARCGDCGWVWVVAYAPMLLTKFYPLLKAARCPRCATNGARIHLWFERCRAEAAIKEQGK